MASKRRPTIRAIWLGQELKKLRSEADLSTREMARFLNVDVAMVSRMENARSLVDMARVDEYLRICGNDDPKRREDLHTICRDVHRKGWWDGYAHDVAAELMDRIWLESKTLEINAFAPIVIPGLLQTPGYARQVMRAYDPAAATEDLDRWIEVRIGRQQIVNRHEPMNLHVVMDEAAVRRAAADPTSARPQLEYLVEVSRRSNIDIFVLPVAAGLHASPSGGFEILTLEDPYPKAGLLQLPSGELCVEGNDVECMNLTYHRLLKVSLDLEESRALIAAVRDSL